MAIEWMDMSWNPATGCTKVSAGCKNCYAEKIAERKKKEEKAGYENGFELTRHERRLPVPRRRKKPTVYFVNSMSDLFHPKLPFAFIDKVMDTIIATSQHAYLILTKRPQIMAKYFAKRKTPNNVRLGVSVENKRHGVPRIDILRSIDARIRFLSVEPLLEDIGEINLRGIDLVIVGGECDDEARPMKEEWVASIEKQCADTKTEFFFKQWGSWGTDGIKRKPSANSREYHGRVWNEIPLVFQPKQDSQGKFDI